MFLITKSLHKEKEQLSIPSNMNQHKEKRGTPAWTVYGFLFQTLWQKMMQKCATRRMYLYKASSFAAWDGYPKKVHSLVGFSTYIPRWWFKSVSQPISSNTGWVYITLAYNKVCLWPTAGLCNFGFRSTLTFHSMSGTVFLKWIGQDPFSGVPWMP